MDIGSATDVGRRRPHNEDSLLVLSHPDQPRRGVLCVVADGMGGHAAGEVASHIAVETLAERYFAERGEVRAALVAAVRQANAAVWEAGNADPSRHGMGTTLVAAAIVGDQATIANVGDSRAYLITQRAIRQVTLDHTWVAEQAALGRLSAQDAALHPFRHMLTRSLGVQGEVEVDLFELPLRPGDALLLCSDGLTAHLKPAELREVVASAPAQQAAQQLVDLANASGGSDNISVIVARMMMNDEW
ncbi:MAG: Stp1/IreP family PP2C-type Ser/Thr phosphatase [Chloroflexi bacterium]|nr:Stp1/IreP family PP2C-type Ser/Thr phosphatase [Chloroflexota bacterium]